METNKDVGVKSFRLKFKEEDLENINSELTEYFLQRSLLQRSLENKDAVEEGTEFVSSEEELVGLAESFLPIVLLEAIKHTPKRLENKSIDEEDFEFMSSVEELVGIVQENGYPLSTEDGVEGEDKVRDEELEALIVKTLHVTIEAVAASTDEVAITNILNLLDSPQYSKGYDVSSTLSNTSAEFLIRPKVLT